MRILLSRSTSGILGGAELSIRDQAVVLKSLGHDPIVVTNLPQLRHDLQAVGIPVQRSLWAQRFRGVLRYLNFVLVWPLMWLHYAYLVWRLKPDVINPHSREDQVMFTLLKPLHHRPVVWKDPGDLRHQLKSQRRNPLARFNEWWLRQAIGRADHIYLLNQEDRQLLAQQVPAVAKRLSVTPSSMLFSSYRLGAAPLSRDQPVIGTIIQLEEHKGVQHLIRAVQLLLAAGRKVELWIVGDGSYRAELERLAASNPAIRFFGHQTDVSTFYRTFSIFVQPALYEAWGRTIKEALYFSLPVVGSNSGGVAEQIVDGQTGLLFAPGQPEDLADKLTTLLDNPKLAKKLGKAGHDWAIKEGDFARIVQQQILPLYEQAAKS